ncbi:MAG TPA: hypothetical protein VJC04_03045 [Candidatus Paceibacterota bacterium]
MPTPDLSAIEVEKKGKEAKEGEGTEAASAPTERGSGETKPVSKEIKEHKESKGK